MVIALTQGQKGRVLTSLMTATELSVSTSLSTESEPCSLSTPVNKTEKIEPLKIFVMLTKHWTNSGMTASLPHLNSTSLKI